MSYLSESGDSGLRDGQDRKRKVEYVGVGSPNPLDEETSPPRWNPRRKLCRI